MTGRTALRGLLAVAAIALATLLVIQWLNIRGEDAKDDAGKAALKAASTSVPNILSYTPDTVMTELDEDTKLLTGSFKDDYRKLVTEVVGPAAVKGRVTTDAAVVADGVISSSDKAAEVLLFVNVTTTSSESADPRISGSRLKITLKKVGGTWLISALEPV